MDFFDAVTPANIPAGAYACLYADGRFRATQQQASRFKAVRWITVMGGAPAAANTGCIDWEKGNPAYEGNALHSWAAQRKAMNCRARVYCSRSDYPRAKELLEGLDNVAWWIATLDGNKLNANYVPNLWATQYEGGMTAKYDVSHLWGTW